jgi:hypothetical protein
VEKRSISVGVAITIVVLLFAATGIASATFTQDSIVSGTGLVMIDKDLNTDPGDLNNSLSTRLHTHGCGVYDADQTVTVDVVSEIRRVPPDYGPYLIRRVSSTIDYCEQAEMTYEPMTLTSGSMVLIDEESAPKWKQDLCIKNYQIGTAMTARFMDADYIKKDIKSNVTCIEALCAHRMGSPGIRETAVPGLGLAKLDILSTVSGRSHVGVVSYGAPFILRPTAADIRVSEDYIGNFTMEKHLKMDAVKPRICDDDGGWLGCPSGDIEDDC